MRAPLLLRACLCGMLAACTTGGTKDEGADAEGVVRVQLGDWLACGAP